MPHVLISKKKCTGCHMCELACSAWHEGVYQPSLARLNVIVNPTTGAIKGQTCFTKAGVLYVDEATCNACADIAAGPQCVPVCPWDVIHIHPQTGKAFKCDLCEGDPQCVAFCQNPHVLAVTQKADKADEAVTV
jgi:carbon-monoxide dehydrogenase iron sulfur subunit